MQVTAHMTVQGVVQGVGFRWFVARKANTLGLKGFARNLANGDVEIKAVGERGLVEELIKDVKVGPRSAHVSNLTLEWSEDEHNDNQFRHFEIR